MIPLDAHNIKMSILSEPMVALGRSEVVSPKCLWFMCVLRLLKKLGLCVCLYPECGGGPVKRQVTGNRTA